MTLRLGIVRPSRVRAVVADAEARVLRAELERRLGPITLDLRIDGSTLGPWQPLAHAAWPAEVDATIEASAIWGDPPRSLTPLFARTVAPAAADTRRRMLAHLGVLPAEPFDLDDAFLAGVPAPIRPTDLWLIASTAATVTVDDPGVQGFVNEPQAAAELDLMLDAAVAGVGDLDTVADNMARLRAERDDAIARADAATTEVDRIESAAEARLSALEAERDALAERLERAELATDPTGPR